MARVLVIEDDESVRLVITSALRDEGYLVDEASEGEAGLALADQRRPDIILLDLKMPGMDGWEFIRQYRARCELGAPILMLTAATNGEARGFDAGADDVLVKPFDLDELDTHIHRLIQTKHARQTAPGSTSSDFPAQP